MIDTRLWTDAAWALYEAVLEARGFFVEHCVHCSGREMFDRGADWGVPGHPHPTCLITQFAPFGSLPPFDPVYYLGC